MRPRRLVSFALLAIVATATVVFWSWIDVAAAERVARARARRATRARDAHRLGSHGLPDPSFGESFATNAWLVRALRAAK